MFGKWKYLLKRPIWTTSGEERIQYWDGKAKVMVSGVGELLEEDTTS